MKRYRLLLLFSFVILILTACAPRQPLDEKFKIGAGESAVIAGTNLKITIDEIGAEWRSIDNMPMEEFPYAHITLKLGAEKIENVYVDLGDDIGIGGYNVYISGCNPFGEAYCSLLVTEK